MAAAPDTDSLKRSLRAVRESSRLRLRRVPVKGFLGVALLVAAASAGGGLARGVLKLPDFVMLYLLVVTVAAVRWGRGPAVLAVVLSIITYDFFFVPPYFGFVPLDLRHLWSFAVMLVVGLVMSGLTSRLREQEQEARQREARTAALYELGRKLEATLDESQAAEVLSASVAELLEASTVIWLGRAGGRLEEVARAGKSLGAIARPDMLLRMFEGDAPGSASAPIRVGDGTIYLPVQAGARMLGVMGVRGARQGVNLLEPPAGKVAGDFLQALVRRGALAIDRAQLAHEAEAAALRARAEETRSSLLSAVSHDLRTPLAAITGAGTALQDPQNLSPAQRAELLDTLCEEAERMERLVGNLLDMTRLESGAIRVKREWVPAEELVGSAVTRLEKRLRGRVLSAELTSDLPLVPVDPVLFQQVIVNLLDNALKYTPAGCAIAIRGHAAEGKVVIEVCDQGPGIAPAALPHVFEKFFRDAHGSVRGAGLGLAICRGIVEAHGGTIEAHNRIEGGAVFRIALPVVGSAPSLPPPAGPDGTEDAT